MRTLAPGALVALATVLLLGACSSDPAPDAGGPAPTTRTTSSAPAPGSQPTSYVALGDSYTAGPGIDPGRSDAGYCQRSTRNWPSVLADTLGYDLTDVSCSGATTADLAATLGSGAVSTNPALVTVGAGGNDGGLFLSLIRACSSDAAACTPFVDDQVPSILEQTTSDLTRLLRDVVADAPDATVVLVGYPRILPATGTCDTAGIAAADAPSAVRVETALDDALAEAAERAGVTYVSPRGPSEGHDACAGDQAWTNGGTPTDGDGIVYHPNRRGMAAVAALVASAVRP